MNTGTEEIKHKILQALRKHKAVLRGIKYGEFADELSETIYGLIGDDMNLDWNMRHGFTPELEKVARKLERGLGIMLKRDEDSVEVYQWLAAQDEAGQPISKWIEWATAEERVQYVNQYRSPGLIRTHYKSAFSSNGSANPQGLEIGF